MRRIAEILKKNCCIFIGAGVPSSIGFPLWNKMAEELVEIIWQNRKTFPAEKISYSIKDELIAVINQGQPITAITYCRDLFRKSNREKDYQDAIKRLLHNDIKYNLTRKNPVYMQIKKIIKKALILQTNLDKSIENHCEIPWHLNTSLPDNISIPCLIYLHGIITEPSSWILTRDEYDDFYQRNNGFINFIQRIFREYDVLFLGYSLQDKEILDQIAKVKDSGKTYILVLAEKERDKTANKIFENLLTHYEINVVRYDVEQEGFDAFANFLRNINSLLISSVDANKEDQDANTLNE